MRSPSSGVDGSVSPIAHNESSSSAITPSWVRFSEKSLRDNENVPFSAF